MNLFHQQLKETTHAAHIRLEKRIVTHIKSMNTTDEYVGLLNAYYAFIHPLEQAIAKHVSPSHLPDIQNRMRAHMILNDIQHLGGDVLKPEEAVEQPAITDLASAVGALYVLEGSTMGGPYIAAMISRRMEAGDALTYFKGYGEDNKLMWSGFLELMTSEALSQHTDQVISSAMDTFEKFDAWMERHQTKQNIHESA